MLAADAIGDTTRDYAAHAAALHRNPAYRDRVYGHARRDAQGRLWLQYWLFYYYNDFQLAGPLLSGGKHEGDWELVQLRLDAGRAARAGGLLPAQDGREQALGRRPQSDQRARDAARLRRARLARQLLHARLALDRRLVRPGRRQGPADHADARDPRGRRSPRGCCGPASGATRRRPARRWTPRARSAPAAARTGSNPSKLAAAPPKQAPPAPAPPRDDGAAHRGRASCVAYEAPPDATALVVALRREGLRRARGDQARSRSTAASGELELPSRRPRLRRLDERRRRRRSRLRGRQGVVTDIASLFTWRRDGVVVAAITGEIDISNAARPRAHDRRRARRGRRGPRRRPRRRSPSSTAPACTCSTRSTTGCAAAGSASRSSSRRQPAAPRARPERPRPARLDPRHRGRGDRRRPRAR